MWLSALLLACSTPTPTPAWAWDPIWLEPVGADAHGFQTWLFYGPEWAEDQDDRHYVCAVVVELDGTPTDCDAEDACGVAWTVAPTVLESDCADPTIAEQPLLVSVTRLALGGPVVAEDLPWPGLTSTGWVDYGGGWEVHGRAWPEALDLGRSVSSGTWDGVEPFSFVPDQAFPWPPAG